MTLRLALLLLLLVNGVLLAANTGVFGPNVANVWFESEREPDRMRRQIRTDEIRILEPAPASGVAAAPAAPASPAASAPASSGTQAAAIERTALSAADAAGACTDSSMNSLRFSGLDYAPVADFDLLRAAVDAARSRDDVTSHVGLIFSGDSFYSPRPELLEPMVAHGVLAIEMEASALYTLAASYARRALAICTVSDHIVTGEQTSAAERETSFGPMVEIALATLSR